uniref:Uncharacterized protein n=1 Tax=Anguilla anguilla TaxID=7936 RepID=A0A0E9PAZ7_ANGAN
MTPQPQVRVNCPSVGRKLPSKRRHTLISSALRGSS